MLPGSADTKSHETASYTAQPSQLDMLPTLLLAETVHPLRQWDMNISGVQPQSCAVCMVRSCR